MTAVDRLQRFRWSGGGGGSGKKSSSGPRSDKAERLRELTEKLKGPAPVPPPRRPSRVQTSPPPSSECQQNLSSNNPQVGHFQLDNNYSENFNYNHQKLIFNSVEKILFRSIYNLKKLLITFLILQNHFLLLKIIYEIKILIILCFREMTIIFYYPPGSRVKVF